MELIYLLFGMAMIYSYIHFSFFIQKKDYRDRTTYEKVVTWFSIVTTALIYLGIMFD